MLPELLHFQGIPDPMPMSIYLEFVPLARLLATLEKFLKYLRSSTLPDHIDLDVQALLFKPFLIEFSGACALLIALKWLRGFSARKVLRW